MARQSPEGTIEKDRWQRRDAGTADYANDEMDLCPIIDVLIKLKSDMYPSLNIKNVSLQCNGSKSSGKCLDNQHIQIDRK